MSIKSYSKNDVRRDSVRGFDIKPEHPVAAEKRLAEKHLKNALRSKSHFSSMSEEEFDELGFVDDGEE